MKKQAIFIITLVAFITIVIVFIPKNTNKEDVKQLQATTTVNTNNTQPSTDNISEVENNKIPAFSLPDINGNEIAIMDEIAKKDITIIDFWASWCGPCMREMPNIKALHEEYKELGIIGISLDEDETSWKNAISELSLTWTQLSDLQGWNNKAARLFEVSSIPYTIVVTKDGTIIATGLRGESLKSFINSKIKTND